MGTGVREEKPCYSLAERLGSPEISEQDLRFSSLAMVYFKNPIKVLEAEELGRVLTHLIFPSPQLKFSEEHKLSAD